MTRTRRTPEASGCLRRMGKAFENLLYYSYITLVFAWFLLYITMGDRWWWLFFLNAGSQLFFFPLPLLFGWALRRRRRRLWLASGAILVLGLALYSPLFVPKRLARADARAPKLTVMSYNVLVFNPDVDAVIAAIKDSNSDVIAIQELGPRLADALRRELSAAYPYQLLEPSAVDNDVTGQGIISRLPLTASTLGEFDPYWFRRPQVVDLEFDGRLVTLVNFHAYPTIPLGNGSVNDTLRLREGQARQLAELARQARQAQRPVLLLGDLNVTERSEAYTIMTSQVVDTWRAAGWGFGHTWPGIAGTAVPLPRWLVRVDYVFCSEHWQPLRAEIGPWDGGSDHRPVLAELQLRGTSAAGGQ